MVKKELHVKYYTNLLKDIKAILNKGLTKAYKAVDNLKVQTYWQIGERIVREELEHKNRTYYGKRIVDMLSEELNIDRGLFYRTVKVYRLYPIVVTVSPQLSWSHYEILIALEENKVRRFYETQSIVNSWSIRELKRRIRGKEYDKIKKKGKIVVKLQKHLPAPDDIFKESYHWDFLSLDEKHTESHLETELLNNIQKVLLEFGKGFAFIGSQQKVLINNQWHKIDLLFYHILLKCYIIVELKARELKQGDIEQVTKYLTYLRQKKLPEDRDPIALIICKSHEKIDVYYSAGKNKEDIFVAEYKTKLPSEKEIEAKLRRQT